MATNNLDHMATIVTIKPYLFAPGFHHPTDCTDFEQSALSQ
ncbi:hypothetical protein Lepto7375DRAFT_0521 [Leptolyngbya sp. PCC 7375]|nr:hypothetical protein Lepto7375DRAFT_0521 [Leptolyngbya sp. PCC 7375]